MHWILTVTVAPEVDRREDWTFKKAYAGLSLGSYYEDVVWRCMIVRLIAVTAERLQILRAHCKTILDRQRCCRSWAELRNALSAMHGEFPYLPYQISFWRLACISLERSLAARVCVTSSFVLSKVLM